MNGNSIAGLVSEVKEKTQSVAFAISSPSFDSALTGSAARGITAGFRPDFERRELPTEAGKDVGQGGFVWLSNNVLSVVERLPKKCRPSVRSVLLAYAQLSSRRGNARTFPAAAELVARLAGCSVSTVHLADKQLRQLGLVTIRTQKVGGRDVPRLVTLSEVSAAPPIPFEVVDIDDIPGVRQYRRRQSKLSSDTGVRLPMCNSDTLKKLPKEINRVSLSKDDEPRCEGMGEREAGDLRNEAMARKHGLTVAEVEKHRREHESNMAAGRRAGRVKGHATEASLDRYIASLPSQTKSAPTTDKTTDKVTEAVALRARWWQQFAATTANVPSSWNGADDDTRKQFMVDSNEGATFLALANSLSWDGAYFEVDEVTGAIAAK
jgi:hypothetical protein